MLSVLTAFVPVTARAGAEPHLAPAGAPEVLYSWQTQRCEDEFIPDSPARAFRRADGEMVLIATHRTNWSLVGPDFHNLRVSCRVMMRSTDYPFGTGRLWIQATYTFDGTKIAALVSQDLSADFKRAGCDPRGEPGRCWVNQILSASSDDMGAHFSLAPPDRRTVATLGDAYPPTAKGRYGVFTTSNIVHRDDGYYMIAATQAWGVQETGNCLFRTSDPMDPGLWRAWDGERFSIDMRSPSTPTPCPRIKGLTSEVRSITYSPRHDRWIAVFAGRHLLPGDEKPVPGFYYATSTDLLNWSRPARITAAPTKPREERLDQVWGYPSLLDPQSKTRNFETVDGEAPVLLFTIAHLDNGRGTMNRDIWYMPLKLD
ncbi:hypothetical protein CH341_06145 [Rhodoplanes roseus]|uniref:Glycosyl hydrolase family 32 N-terminal domain-containing protein n=1 Tax=Rhodoplanes roseus TaxID=29409 RepID=A0A327L1N1_9BRAD|nr:hypothetical protein CH341_06145 [Rhodoplanes roseus]